MECIYIRNDWNFSEINDLSTCNANIESIFIKITNSNEPITVRLIYRPPSGNLASFNEEFESIISNLPDKNCYLLGDYNVIHSFIIKFTAKSDKI